MLPGFRELLTEKSKCGILAQVGHGLVGCRSRVLAPHLPDSVADVKAPPPRFLEAATFLWTLVSSHIGWHRLKGRQNLPMMLVRDTYFFRWKWLLSFCWITFYGASFCRGGSEQCFRAGPPTAQVWAYSWLRVALSQSVWLSCNSLISSCQVLKEIKTLK